MIAFLKKYGVGIVLYGLLGAVLAGLCYTSTKCIQGEEQVTNAHFWLAWAWGFAAGFVFFCFLYIALDLIHGEKNK